MVREPTERPPATMARRARLGDVVRSVTGLGYCIVVMVFSMRAGAD